MAARIEGVKVSATFPTPILVAQLAEFEALNAELARIVLAREAVQATTRHSNQGGWQSSWDMLDWGGAPAQAVVAAAKTVADRFTADRQGAPAPQAWTAMAWANINRGGHSNVVHAHGGCYWSGTYYIDDGGCAGGSALGGEFEIHDPRGPGPAMYAPLLTYALPGMQSVGGSERIPCQAGRLILFPAWLMHGVTPYTGGRSRISMAFNLGLAEK
ncbi:MAG: hypothetical protein FJX46_09490 [Alphaproteobacteria bacterium]|nr:hypothetical protein [Alphaproteobacteria bacterium]